jgi:hypothetical protein
MVRIRFNGRIYPEAISVSMTNLPSVRWSDGGMIALGLEPACHTKIENNVVTMDVDIQRFDTAYFTPLVMRAYDTARSAIDLVSFATGNGHTFLLETWVNPSGETVPLAAMQPALGALATAVNGARNFHDVIWLLMRDPPLFLALRDLIDAITQWHQTPIAAARAIERLRHLALPGVDDRRKQWRRLGELLQLEDSYTKIIRGTSVGPRHGDPAHIPGTTTTEIATRAWVIMNRFIEFRKRGGADPLPVSEFPLLA